MTDRFAVVGSGFRARAFLRVAREMTDLEACAVVARNPETGGKLARDYGIPHRSDFDALLARERPAFVVVSVDRNASEALITRAVAAGLPVLAETPPAVDVDGLTRLHRMAEQGARIQVAEQYHLEPLVSAQIRIARSGMLGRVSEAFVSVAHDYHGVSVVRRLLGIGFEDATITASATVAPLTAGPSRAGDPTEHHVIEEQHVTARLDFGDVVGWYDFSSDQYRSWIRTGTVLVRGDRGELRDETVRRLVDPFTPNRLRIERLAAGGPGSHEGMFLRGLSLGGEWVYRNDFMPARLADEELSIAAMLRGMQEYAHDGPEIYSLGEAAQDQYLQLMIRRAVVTGEAVRTERQPWATASG